MAHRPNGPISDPGIRLILEELRDTRVEMRADRRRSDERFQRLMRASDARFERMMRAVGTVGLAIARTLDRHTRLLERIDRKLGARDNARPGQGNGRGA